MSLGLTRPVTMVEAADGTHPGSQVDGVASYFSWHEWTNRAGAAFLLLLSMPVIAVLVVLVRLSSRGPGIFAQQRVGRHGRLFTMYKIRTMTSDAESRTGAVWSQPGDARVTGLGRVLRALHLDELPQLWNVVCGEMALIGPRPERPEFTRLLAEELPGYYDRLAVLPGITGLAQINLPPDSDLDSVRRKLILDLEYIRTASFGLDFRIALRTILRLFSIHGDWPSRVLGLLRTVELPAAEPAADAAPDMISLVTGNGSAGHAVPAHVNGHAKSAKNLLGRAKPAPGGAPLPLGRDQAGASR